MKWSEKVKPVRADEVRVEVRKREEPLWEDELESIKKALCASQLEHGFDSLLFEDWEDQEFSQETAN